MSESTRTIHEYALPNPDTVGTLSDLDAETLRIFKLLSYADDSLQEQGELCEPAVLDTLENVATYGHAFVSRHPDTAIVRGALVAAPGETPATYDIELLAVDPAYRKSGIGSELLEFAEQHARKLGARVLSLQAINKPEVTAFYERNGFEPLHQHGRHFVPMIRTL